MQKNLLTKGIPLGKILLCVIAFGQRERKCHLTTIFLLISILSMSGVSVSAQTAQTAKVTGRVMGESDLPMTGVVVQIKDDVRGVITGNDGTFELMAKPTDMLVVSFLGYATLTVAPDFDKSMLIKLELKVNEMDGVVVAAFGVQKKASVVSSIETISAKELRMPSSNLTTALAGRAAGLISMQKSGEPGRDDATFFIRGVTTFGYQSRPLIILDGFEVSQSVLARVDPDNIEQFAILKDATAAALYGSKGANGVIEVTTKRGDEGAVKLMFRAESRFSMPTQLPKFVDGVEYMDLYNEADFNDNPLNGGAYYSPQKIQNTINRVDPYAFPDTNWHDAMFNKMAYNQYYMLNISGGSKVANYYAALSYSNEKGLLKNSSNNNFKNNIGINRYNALANMDFKLTPTTKLSLNMSSIFESTNGPGIMPSSNGVGFDIFRSVINANPVDFPLYYEPDEYHSHVKHTLFGNMEGVQRQNPYADMVKGYSDGYNFDITSHFTLTQDLKWITEGLSLKAKYAINNSGSKLGVRAYDPYFYAMKNYNEATGEYRLVEVAKGGDALGDPAISSVSNSNNYFEAGLYYNHTFGNHEVGAVAIYTQSEKLWPGSGGNALAASLPARNQAIRARMTYAFDSRYLAEASFTYQGSEKFFGANKWGTFPAVAVGYVISNEEFWRPLLPVIDKLKFKASYGIVGNDNISSAGERFFFLSDISTAGWGYPWGQNFNNSYNRYEINRYSNPDITWELAYKTNVGVEMGLANGLVKLQFDWFREHRKNIYMKRVGLPASMGLTADISGNSGEARSQGFDGSLDLNHIFNKDFWITGRFNFTYTTNRIIKVDELQYKDQYLSRVGMDMDQMQGYIAERLFIDWNDVQNAPPQNITSGTVQLSPGDIKYKDVNGDGVVDTNDRVPIGNSRTPGINYGFGFSAGLKWFDISCFFQGMSNVSFFMNTSDFAPFVNHRNALEFIADDHWSPNNPIAQAAFPRLTTANNKNNYYQYSTWWMRDGTLLRLKSLELGYNFPERLSRKIMAESVRIYLSGQNLFCIKKFDLWDPEMGSSGLGYPLQRVFCVGLNINF